MFAVGKKDSLKMREVWHGSALSEAARRPPPPPYLASPTSLLHLESSDAEPLLVSKRDGRCLFDQLAAPVELQEFFGRPPVRLRELVATGDISRAELMHFTHDLKCADDHVLVYPASRVWPMGFAWSSCIAQTSMLKVCETAVLETNRIMCDSLPTPYRQREVFALATDDIMLFFEATNSGAPTRSSCSSSAERASWIASRITRFLESTLPSTRRSAAGTRRAWRALRRPALCRAASR